MDETMPVTILDIVVIIVVLISAVLAMVRGFVREILSVASWVAAAAAAYLAYKPVVPMVQPYFQSKTVAVIVSAAAIFFIALIVASYVTMKISDFVIDSRIGAIDRALGFVFGAVRGLLLLVIALLFFNWLVPAPPAWVSAARSKPLLGRHAGQQREPEAGGTVSVDGSQFHQERRVGQIGDSFTERAVIDRLAGSRAIGHVRYATHGGSLERNIQPLFAEFAGGGFAV